jgi:hypothetical protein
MATRPVVATVKRKTHKAVERHTPTLVWAVLVSFADTALTFEGPAHEVRLLVYIVLYRSGELAREVLWRHTDPHGRGSEVVRE